ncbi:MAG: hypothetical protein O3C45_09885 [Bacteroidetes bacterium]|nr:hypothetical protein [Bacteroidota bacterium]MDA0875352.1 hypothetical protein [Bacteroidota bacterium]
MIRIPFTLPDVGLREIEGMISVEEGFIVLDLSDKLLGLVDLDEKTIKIEPAALLEVRLQRRPFKDRLVLVPKKKTLLDAVPGKHATDVRLRIWRTQRSQTERLMITIEALRLQKSLPDQPQGSLGPEGAP